MSLINSVEEILSLAALWYSMAEFTNEEYTDMNKIYGEYQGNIIGVWKMYVSRFPNWRRPSYNTFRKNCTTMRKVHI